MNIQPTDTDSISDTSISREFPRFPAMSPHLPINYLTTSSHLPAGDLIMPAKHNKSYKKSYPISNIVLLGYYVIGQVSKWSIGSILTPLVSVNDTIEDVLENTSNGDIRSKIYGIYSGWSPENCTIVMQPQDTFNQCCVTNRCRNWLLIYCAVTLEWFKKDRMCWCCGRLVRHNYQNCPNRNLCCYESGQSHKSGQCPSNTKYKENKPQGIPPIIVKENAQRMFISPIKGGVNDMNQHHYKNDIFI
ncbi:6761_t:CDS:2 [Ambispora gerdemannii]|uniref:6761_t:CDS:1 n=1 Tax=Ambispora gerdemannii TaxID=144530 RepID=A0A9N9CIH0_9GLOM|nr:6761_t:CDS:2 [Ambispora gerdemannii]